MISGATRVVAVIGVPIRHSLSPAIHNAAFAAAGLDWVCVACEVPSGAGARAVEAMRSLGLAGLSVTMPHKADAAVAVDRLSDDAAALGAVNCVVAGADGLIGHNTDGAGFIAALRADPGWEPAGRRALVLGAGGAARAVVRALARAGASAVLVANRDVARAAQAAALAGPVGLVAGTDVLGEVDLVVNATPLGMVGHPDTPPLNPDRLGPGQLVVDLVYDPRPTLLVSAARDRGATAVDGLGMLVHQAALAFTHWTGVDAPVEAMKAAAAVTAATAG